MVLFVGQCSVVNAREPAIILKANSVGTEATHAVEEALLALCFSIRLELTDCQSELRIVCPVAKKAYSSKIEWGEISLIEPAVDQPIWISDDKMQLLAILDRTRREVVNPIPFTPADLAGRGICERCSLLDVRMLAGLTVTHIFLLWAKDLISLADPAALGGRARERTCSMKPVIGPRPSSGRPTLGMPDAPTVS